MPGKITPKQQQILDYIKEEILIGYKENGMCQNYLNSPA